MNLQQVANENVHFNIVDQSPNDDDAYFNMIDKLFEQEPQMLYQMGYYLNGSHTLGITMGLSPSREFLPTLKIGTVPFDRHEFFEFTSHFPKIKRFFDEDEDMEESGSNGDCNIRFLDFAIELKKTFNNRRFAQIWLRNKLNVVLKPYALETLKSLGKLIDYRFKILEDHQFYKFYNDALYLASCIDGDVIQNIYSQISNQVATTPNHYCLLELLCMYPKRVLYDIEIIRLYA